MWRFILSSLLLVSACKPNYVPGDEFRNKLQQMVDTHINLSDLPRLLPDVQANVLSETDKAAMRIRRASSEEGLKKMSTYPVTAVVELDSATTGFLFFDQRHVLRDFHIQPSS